jgi:hypothetical protein
VLTFNYLLALEGIDTAKVRLIRHRDGRLGAARLYGAWRTYRDAFEHYQSVQSRDQLPARWSPVKLRRNRGPQDSVRGHVPARTAIAPARPGVPIHC